MSPPGSHILEAILCDGRVLLNFRLGVADGILLFCRRGPEEEFLPLAEDEAAPVVDARPKLDPHRPEIRHYRAIIHYANAMCLLSNEIVLIIP